MRAEIISIGDELLFGVIVNTNAPFIAEKLTSLGLDVGWITTVGDCEEDLLEALHRAVDRASMVILTGGLGPTHDDITRKVVSQFLQSRLIFKPDIYSRIEKWFQERGFETSETNRIQAMIPEGGEIIENSIGTAPGLFFEKGKCSVFVLPGVSKEMQPMLENYILPRIRRKAKGEIIKNLTLRTADVPESTLSYNLIDFNNQFPDIKLGFQPQKNGVSIRLSVRGSSVAECQKKLDLSKAYIYKKIDPYIFGEDHTSMEQEVARLLSEKNLTISVAESCTGGLVSHKLTNVPGSSVYFHLGMTVYSNRAKIDLLGVSEDIIRKYGAVSKETAEAMAVGVRRKGNTDIGIATTGIAGPGGGSKEKPVGLVFFGYADESKTWSESRRYSQDRLINKERFAVGVLNLLRRILLK